MELATVLQGKGLSLELHWAPRLQNSLADSLTNQDFKSFNPELRRRFSFSSYQSVVMKDMLDLGSTLYKDIAEWKSRKRGHTVQDKNAARSKASTSKHQWCIPVAPYCCQSLLPESNGIVSTPCLHLVPTTAPTTCYSLILSEYVNSLLQEDVLYNS